MSIEFLVEQWRDSREFMVDMHNDYLNIFQPSLLETLALAQLLEYAKEFGAAAQQAQDAGLTNVDLFLMAKKNRQWSCSSNRRQK